MKNKRPYKTEGDRKNGLIDRQAADANAEQLTKAAQEKIITRRDFLQTAGVAAIGAVAVACAPAAVPAPAVVPATAVPEIAPTAAPVEGLRCSRSGLLLFSSQMHRIVT